MDRPVFREPPPAPLSILAPPPATSGNGELHELRVRLPADLHRQLLSLKILRGKSLAETVSLALELYFADAARTQAMAADPDGTRSAS